MTELAKLRARRASAIAAAGSFEAALSTRMLPNYIDTTLSEALVLGLLRQGVRIYLTVLGHGSTEIGEVLRIYQAAGLLRTFGVRSEIEASHAATALRWVSGEKAAVVTSIGPGALQALAASIAPASDGVGVWYLFGDETTEDEGPNMQQIPKHEQHNFLQLCATLGRAYNLETPLALPSALRRGLNTVDHPFRAGPFYLLLPINTQPALLPQFNLDELPVGAPPKPGAASGDIGPSLSSGLGAVNGYELAVDAVLSAQKVVVKVGGGARQAGPELSEFLDLADGVAVTSPLVSGVIPYQHPRNMTVGGSKGSISGNFAMENADLLVAVGSRFVCQADCSRTGYPLVQSVININADLDTATHYGRTIALVGDAGATLRELNNRLKQKPPKPGNSPWFRVCSEKRREWENFKQQRYDQPTLYDEVWGKDVLTQPAVIKAATDWARSHDVVSFFDAGDVQANGFQIVEDDRPGRTFTETGASYMGFSASALLATGLGSQPFYGLAFSGDGSLAMCPQILIDGAEHGANGCILVLDNRRMGAITGLQLAQYGAQHATRTAVPVDFAAWGRSVKGVLALDGGQSIVSVISGLDQARAYAGLSLIHVPVYFGQNELSGMGVFGRWNVGSWVGETQALRHKIGL
jgi:3D-(3,5/4)-trihydroxycyclohexane-1,2-dione acylhydrolase (decyclizing)